MNTDLAMPKEKAHRTLAQHLFRAYLKYSDSYKTLVLLADDIKEAERLAMEALGTSSIMVTRVIPTENPQVYEV